MSTIPNEGGGGHIIQDEGTSLTVRAKLNFKGAGVTAADNAGTGATDVTVAGGGGSGTVTDVSVVSANGVSGTVATSTTTPAITLALGAITPSTVNGVTLSGTSSPTLAVTGTSSISGTNTGDNAANNTSQPVDATLTALAALDATAGFVKQTGADTFTKDTNTYLTTETDPVVKAINGIVKSNGSTISAATADTDYATPTLARQLGVDINRYGFLNRAETTLSFDGTDTLTLGSVGASWSYYRAGLKYTITGNKTKQLASPMVDGTLYYIYIDATDGTLTSSTNAWTLADTKVPVATVYWDSTLTPKYIKADERHTVGIDRAFHREHHSVEGTKCQSFGTVSGLTAGSDTPSTKTFGISGTVIFDEDLKFALADLADPDGATAVYPIVYRTSATTYAWVMSDMPFKYTTSAGPVYGFGEYDLNGTSTPAGASQFFNTYIYASSSVAGSEANPEISTSTMRFFIMQGRGAYNTAALATAEKFLVSAGMPTAEGVCLYQLTWATTNRPDTVKGRCRFVSIQQVAANNITTSVITATAHNGLAGIDGGTTNEYYHLTAAEYTPTATTGSGAMARCTSPTFTTPILGTPQSGTLTNCTGYPAASTSAAGVAPQATAPASGLYNYVGITNGETAYTNKALFDATAPSTQAFGDSASTGSAAVAARRDHKHAMMAAPTSVSGSAGSLAAQYIDWNSSSGGDSIKNKPSIPTFLTVQVFS